MSDQNIRSRIERHSHRHSLVSAAVCALLFAGCAVATGDEASISGGRHDAGQGPPSTTAPPDPGTPVADAGDPADPAPIPKDPGDGDSGVLDSGSGGAPVADSGSGWKKPWGDSGGGSPTDSSGTPPGDTGSGGGDTGSGGGDTGSGGGSDTGGTTTKTLLGKYVVTWYSFQDNTPTNSALSASGRPLYPYISVAVPFRLLKSFGGKLDYGDKLYIEFLDGRTMPNGMKHTGWVQIDDFCGDSGDDSYCFQSVGGTKYPNTDLYIGDFTKSGMDPKACTGPAGSGGELTNVSTGTPGSAWISDYGGSTLGSGKCGDTATAKSQQGACWDYTPPASSASECKGCTSTTCKSW